MGIVYHNKSVAGSANSTALSTLSYVEPGKSQRLASVAFQQVAATFIVVYIGSRLVCELAADANQQDNVVLPIDLPLSGQDVIQVGVRDESGSPGTIDITIGISETD